MSNISDGIARTVILKEDDGSISGNGVAIVILSLFVFLAGIVGGWKLCGWIKTNELDRFQQDSLQIQKEAYELKLKEQRDQAEILNEYVATAEREKAAAEKRSTRHLRSLNNLKKENKELEYALKQKVSNETFR